jgi:hypothetical protein
MRYINQYGYVNLVGAVEVVALIIGTALLSWVTDWQTGVSVGCFVWYSKPLNVR